MSEYLPPVQKNYRLQFGGIFIEIAKTEDYQAEVKDMEWKGNLPLFLRDMTKLFAVIDLDADALLENAIKAGCTTEI